MNIKYHSDMCPNLPLTDTFLKCQLLLCWAVRPMIHNDLLPVRMITACSKKCEKTLIEDRKHFLLATLTPFLNSKESCE